MRERPAGVDDDDVRVAVADGWGLDVRATTYVPEGGGSYHWRMSVVDHDDVFVTVDDLDSKPWLGDDRDTTFDGLCGAFDTAVRLRAHGRAFVVAPLSSRGGRSLERLAPRYGIAVFPWVEGRPGTWGQRLDRPGRADLSSLLAQLHGATEDVASVVPRHALDVAGRGHLDDALADVDTPWAAGPFGEPARRALAPKSGQVREWLATFDELAARVGRSGAEWVVTHGEPHPANTIRTTTGLVLVDWDTVALAPRERDLWMLDDGATEPFSTYTRTTGVPADPDAVELFRLTWTLEDLASYGAVLRSPHDDNADTRKALRAFCTYLT